MGLAKAVPLPQEHIDVVHFKSRKYSCCSQGSLTRSLRTVDIGNTIHLNKEGHRPKRIEKTNKNENITNIMNRMF